MKKLITLMLFVGFVGISFGQTKEKAVNKIYMQLGLGGCGYKGFSGDIGVQAAFRNNWIASFSSQTLEMDAKNKPADYRPGITTVFFLSVEDNPTIAMNLYSLTAGKYFKTGRNTWFSTEGGLSYVKGDKVNFTRNTGNPTGWTLIIVGEQPSNYITTVEKKTTFGGVFKADFNWAFASFAGLGAGVFTNLNSIQSTVGYEVKLSLGWMNRKSKHS
jgi:hypothetical protein